MRGPLALPAVALALPLVDAEVLHAQRSPPTRQAAPALAATVGAAGLLVLLGRARRREPAPALATASSGRGSHSRTHTAPAHAAASLRGRHAHHPARTRGPGPRRSRRQRCPTQPAVTPDRPHARPLIRRQRRKDSEQNYLAIFRGV